MSEKISRSVQVFKFLLLLAGSFVCLYIAFSATVNIPYVAHDSVCYFHKFYNKESTSQFSPLYAVSYLTGRPLTAELEEFIYRKINHLSDLSRLRLITIFVFALSASLLALTALFAGMGMIPAFCLSTVIFTLPGVQNFIFVPYLHFALAIFLSLLAYFILSNVRRGLNYIFAFVLLETSFWIYQPSTFFFLIPTALILIFHNNWQLSKKIWIRDVFLWGLAALINYFILRVFFYTQMRSTEHEIAFTLQQIQLNIMTFLPQGVPQIFNLWNVYYSKTLGILMVIFVTVFIMVDFFVAKKIGWGRLLALSVIFLVFNLVWFLFGGYMPREFIASQAVVLVLVYWCGEWLGNICKKKSELLSKIWPIAFLCIGLITTKQTMTYNVLNNNSELMFVRSRLAQFVNSSPKEIHVVLLKDSTKGYNGLPRVYDNLNSSVSGYEVPDLIRAALKDSYMPTMHCIVTSSDYGKPYRLSDGVVVINMNDLMVDSQWKKYINSNFDSSKSLDSQSTVIYPDDIDYIDHGIDAANEGNLTLALAFYGKAIEINPYDAMAYYDRANIYSIEGNYTLALSDYGKAIEIDPLYSDAYSNRGLVYYKQGNYSLALADYVKAIEINPRNVDAFINRGLIYGSQNNYKLSMVDYGKAIEIDPNRMESYINRGILTMQEGGYKQAVIDFGKAIKINSNVALAYNERAICYFYIKDYPHAWQDVQKARALGSNADQQLLEDLKRLNPNLGKSP